jgi:hypothetical protein
MSQLSLAVNFINGTDGFVGFDDDGVGYGHLQIVFTTDTGALFETEVSAPFFITAGNWNIDDYSNIHNDTGNTPNYCNPDFYQIVSIDLG